MFSHPPTRIKAILIALFVTLLWSTSWILIKIGLEDIPAISFAGLRYFLAFLSLLPFALTSSRKTEFRTLKRHDWLILVILGILYYAITQGTQFLGLTYLPAITVSLILNLTSIFVAGLGIIILKEKPGLLQWIGVLINISGVIIYFYPVSFPKGQWIGLAIVGCGMLANAFSSVIGRDVNRKGRFDSLTITIISMGIGSLLLLISGVAFEEIPPLNIKSWLLIAWLAIFNTAIAFTLWNYTLKTLSAMESSIINSTMLVQIALLAWLFLGEQLNGQQILGMLFAGAGAILVQLQIKPGISGSGRSKNQDTIQQ
jgi:drug/metabolite transporter (DMT)-like permease